MPRSEAVSFPPATDKEKDWEKQLLASLQFSFPQQKPADSGFSTTVTTADTTINNHHYHSNYAFRGEANSCSGWYECCIEYTCFSWSDTISNKDLETFLINLTPSVSSMPQ